MANISEGDYKYAIDQLSNLGGEIKKYSSIIKDYNEQLAKQKQEKALERINSASLKFREGFAVLVERAIASKYVSLDEYVRIKKVSPVLLKRFLNFQTSGAQLLNFIFNADMCVQVTTTENKSAFFPLPPSTFSEVNVNERVFRQEFEKILNELLLKNFGGRQQFQAAWNFDRTEMNKVMYFDFRSETELLKLIYLTGSKLEVTYKYETVEFPG